MTERKAKTMRLLIGYDGSSQSDAAIADLAFAGLPKHAEALVACVAHEHLLPPLDTVGIAAEDYPSNYRAKLAEAEALNARAIQRIRDQYPEWVVSSEALWGSPAPAILKTVDRWHPDLLIVGAHGRPAALRVLLGSVSLELLHRAPCSVRIVRTGPAHGANPPRILIAYDGSPQAQAAVREVAGRSWPFGTEVRVLSIQEMFAPSAVLTLEAGVAGTAALWEVDQEIQAHRTAALRDACSILSFRGLQVSESSIGGDPRREVVAEAERWRAHAVFMGASGLGDIERILLGSVSTATVTHAHCTVEIVRHR